LCKIDKKDLSNELNEMYCKHTLLKQKCTSNYCSKDENTCKHFQVINSMLETKYFRKNNINLLKEYDRFLNNIKPCVLDLIKFRSQNICFRNKKKCMIKMPFESVYKHIDCQCPKKSFKVSCNKNYCARDITSCFGLMGLKKDNNKMFKNCSSNKVIFFLFKIIFIN
jgi:hypothetical protein